MRQVRELTDLRIDEISLVDKGANQHAIVSIAKRDGAEEETMSEEYFDSDGYSVDVDDLDYGDVVYDADGQGYEVTEDDGDYEDYGDVEKNFVARAAGAARNFGQGIKGGEGAGRAYGYGASARYGAQRVDGHVKGNKRAYGIGAGAAAAGYGAGRINKADNKKVRASDGARLAAATIGAPATAIQGKSGNKLNAFGNVLGGTLAGQVAGGVAGGVVGAARRDPVVGMHAGRLLSTAGGIGGAIAGADRAAQKGYLKDKWVKKSYGEELREEFSKALSDNDRDEVISKALDYIDAANENAEMAYYAAEMERNARLEAEFTEVAKGYSVGVDAEILGPVLKRMTEVMDEDDVDVIVTALSTASDVVEKSFEEYGAAGLGDQSDVLFAVDNVVESMVSKSGGDFSREEAVAGIFEENPEAYDEYLAERRYL